MTTPTAIYPPEMVLPFGEKTFENIRPLMRKSTINNKCESMEAQTVIRLKDLKSLKKVDRPETLKDLDALIAYSENRYTTISHHDHWLSSVAKVASLKKEIDSLKDCKEEKIIQESLLTQAQIDEKLEGMFAVPITVIGSSIKGERMIYDFIIGDHICKPTEDSVDQSYVSYQDRHPSDWLDNIKECGLARPAMHVQLTAQVYGSCFRAPDIRIPFSDYNKAVDKLIVNKNGNHVDMETVSLGALGGHHPDAITHLHMRANRCDEDDKFFSACMGDFTHYVNEAMKSGDFLYMCSLVTKFITQCDLHDGWVQYSLFHFGPDFVAECEPERPIWIPEFIIEPLGEGEGVLEFMNKPDNFEYKFNVVAENLDATKRKIIESETDGDPVIIDKIDELKSIKVITEQDKTVLINMGRRR